MRAIHVVLGLCLLVGLVAIVVCSRVGATTPDAERQAVTATVQVCFQGHAEARPFWVRGGGLAQKTSASDAAMVRVELKYPSGPIVHHDSPLTTEAPAVASAK